MQSSHALKFLTGFQMDTHIIILEFTIIIERCLLRVALCTTTVTMVTFFLEMIREHVKPMEHGLVNRHNVVSCCP